MSKKKIEKKSKKIRGEQSKSGRFALPEEVKRVIWAAFMFLGATIITLSFFDAAGSGGRFLIKGLTFLFGKTTFIFPVFLILGGLSFIMNLKYKNKWPVVFAILLLALGASGIFGSFSQEEKIGGWLGYAVLLPFVKTFGTTAARIILGSVTLVGLIIFWQFLYKPRQAEKPIRLAPLAQGKSSVIKKIFGTKFKVKPIGPLPLPPVSAVPQSQPSMSFDLKTKPLESRLLKNYNLPPADLLESDKGVPSAGDIRINSAIIKRTLQNFDIQVEMSEVNIGPTVTQYTLKPAEGIKLSKITTLSSDLSLALAAHPIRIEAPIPGRPLVGIEIPNRVRTVVRLKNLIEHPNFQNSVSTLTLALGRDVAANPAFADLARMPHLLVAGSTGTGKTICLNSVILSLLYQNSPETLRLILIDPKRVEFHIYNDLPHLLTPVIQDAQKSVNVLKWLVSEMERRFDVLSSAHARDIGSYNDLMQKQGESPILPYIVLVVDELADLMAARGRDIEAGIVRLAQMARAVGIHLIVASQRPSVEVITGLIKANITSRITFQVASQVDSRTVLDMAGAEKLLGAGDMLFVSAETVKARRLQGGYISDKEVKRVVKYIKDQAAETEDAPPELNQELEKTMEAEQFDFAGGSDDPLFEDAKKLVIEARKASSSLLQRRLRVGYARAARLIDMLEEKGVVGPGEGAKPREILISTGSAETGAGLEGGGSIEAETAEDPEGWKKI